MLSHFSTTMKVSSPYFAGEAGLSMTGPYSNTTSFGENSADHGTSLLMLVLPLHNDTQSACASVVPVI